MQLLNQYYSVSEPVEVQIPNGKYKKRHPVHKRTVYKEGAT